MGRRNKAKFREKMDMYDMIVASLLDRNNIVIPDDEIDSRQLAIGFSCVASMRYASKYFAIIDMPDFVDCSLYDEIRRNCISKGVIIDFFTYSEPHKIDWNSSEMRGKLRVWKNYYENENEGSVFDYRDKKQTIDNKRRIVLSTKYLNQSELDNRRTLSKVYTVIRVTAKRDTNSIMNMVESIDDIKRELGEMGIKIRELRINMMDWCRLLNPLCLIRGQVYTKLPKRVMTDDVEANFLSIKQGKVGETGIPLGMDIKSGQVVLYKFKENPEAAENVLVSGETGSGKSYLMKPLISYLLADGMVGTIMDYEGDEYINLGKYIAASNKDDVCIINIGKNSEYYFDPCPIPSMTGETDIDSRMKQMAMEYIKLTFQKIICKEDDDELNNQQVKVLSLAIQRMYDSVGVIEDSSTWHSRSKNLRLKDVYDEINDMVIGKEFYTADGSSEMFDAAKSIVEATSTFFEEGEIYAGTFGIPLSLDKIYNAKLIIFAFGVKGQASSVTDKKILSLKQISLAYISTLISNHCKYVKKCYNFKIWEEGQRWLHLAGSSDIIINEITGGRKRGDINFIATNDIGELLKETDRLGEALTSNIQHYFIGKIPRASVRKKFCSEFQITHILPELDRIAKAKEKGGGNNKYVHAFALVLQNGSTPVIRAELPKAISESKIYSNSVK